MDYCVEHLGLPTSLLPDRVREKGSNRLALGLELSAILSFGHRFEFLSYQ